MISVGILDGAGPTQARRRRRPQYRLLPLIIAICLAVFTSSYLSHSSHNQQPSDVQKRSIFDEFLGFNDSLIPETQELVSPELVSRTASQALWDRKVSSGRRLWCMMNSNNVQAGTTTMETLSSTGWLEDAEIPDDEAPADWHRSLGTVDGKMNKVNEVAVIWYHENPWKDAEDRLRKPTQATMGNIVNGEDGYIIAGVNYGPRDTRPKDVEDWELPDTKWTDLLAVQWQKHAKGGDLKRVYRSKVVYSESRDLIETALEKIGKIGDVKELPLWPGYEFTPGKRPMKTPPTPETEAFMGLLGCSHVAGPAYLVIQYRAIFGKKRISKIKVWKVEDQPEANMLIYMEDIK